MNTLQEKLIGEGLAFIYEPSDILWNLCLACFLGMVISQIYKSTHKGLSYSQSFMLTLVFVTLVVSMVMMIIGNNLARAFALVGALSIIRFRTVVKDTKDTAYIFWSLASGMATGTGSYFLAIAGNAILSLVAFILFKTNYDVNYSLFKDLALLVSTSGSTGTPKFSRLSYDNLKSNANSIINYLDINHTDRSITTMPISYSFMLSVLNTHLIKGASIIVTNSSVVEIKRYY